MTKSQKRRLQRKQSKNKSKRLKSDAIPGVTCSTICWAKQVNNRVRLEVFSREKFYIWWGDSLESSLFRNILKDLKTLKALALKHNIHYKEVTQNDVGHVVVRCAAHPARGINVGCYHCNSLLYILEEKFLKDYAEYAYSAETYKFVTSHYLFSLTRNW